MNQEPKSRIEEVDNIIRNHIVWSMGAGLIPVLVADIFAVSALQLDMVRQMSKVYEIDFGETQGKAIVTALTGSTLARLGAGSVIKLIPGVGSVLGGVTVSVFAGASTYALGEVFKKHFESGGTILDFDPDRLRKYYRQKFEKGKKIAKKMADEEAAKTKTPTVVSEPEPEPVPPSTNAVSDSAEVDDVITRLKEIARLKDEGILSQEEFELMKKKLIDEF